MFCSGLLVSFLSNCISRMSLKLQILLFLQHLWSGKQPISKVQFSTSLKHLMDVQTFFRVLNHHWSSGLGLKLNRNSVGENWDKKAKSLILTVCSWVMLFKIKTLHVCLPGQIMKLTMLVMPNSWRQVSVNLLDLRSWKQKKWLFGTVTAHKTNRSIRLEVCSFLAWFSRLS